MKPLQAFGTFLFLCTAGAALSNDVPPVPIDQQLSQADLVVVGTLGESNTCPVDGLPVRCAELISDAVLKGSRAVPGLRRFVLLSSGQGEDRIDILYIPSSALIFLRQREGELYEPLYGDRSVFPLIFRR
jgi:hypothetical protein